MRNTSKQFTLIELLIIITIMSILLSILLPTFKRAREKVERATCLSNLKQQSYAIASLLKDESYRYPQLPVYYGLQGVTNKQMFNWLPVVKEEDRLLSQYIGTSAAFCPSTKRDAFFPDTDIDIADMWGTSYIAAWCYNRNSLYGVMQVFGGYLGSKGKFQAQIEEPTKKIISVDWNFSGNRKWANNAGIHGGNARSFCTLFADSSARFYKFDLSMENWNPWNVTPNYDARGWY